MSITYEQFKEIEIRVGEIVSVERVPETDKLLRLMVNLGGPESRQVISGIAEYFPDHTVLVGMKCAFVANLAPRTIRGLESNGMILASSGEDGSFSLLRVDQTIPAGSVVK